MSLKWKYSAIFMRLKVTSYNLFYPITVGQSFKVKLLKKYNDNLFREVKGSNLGCQKDK